MVNSRTFEDFRGVAPLSGAGAPIPPVAGGKVLQVVNVNDGAVATGTGIIAIDDTIPQNTEGAEFMTLVITPASANNFLIIEVDFMFSVNDIGTIAASIFQDSTANALATAAQRNATSEMFHITFDHYVVAGTASATTFKLRVGFSTGGTITMNGVGGARRYGGVAASSMRITEIEA